LRVPALDERAGVELWLKCENLQAIGAFKARGAMHALDRLDPELRKLGVITFSSGNHAQAVALAARSYGVTAHIAMPTDAPPIKLAAVRALGAEVVLAGTTSDERKAVAMEIHARTQAPVIQPFDHPHIVCGAGTATLELHEQVAAATGGETLDGIFVPVGGGGVIAGACVATRGRPTAIYSAEPHTCDAMARSLEAGERVAVEPGPTIADGLKPVRVGALNFAVGRRDIRAPFRVDDHELGEALVQLLVRGKVLVEPSGAAGLATAIRESRRLGLQRVGVILTGGNIEPRLLGDLLERHRGAI
jgi:threonine dehydratase